MAHETTIERRDAETLVRSARDLMPTQTFLGCAIGARRSEDFSVDIPVEHEEDVLPRSLRTVTGLPPARVAQGGTLPLRKPPRVGPPPLPAASSFPPLARAVRRGPPPLPYIPPPMAMTVRPGPVVTVSTRPRRSGKKVRWAVALVALGMGIGLWLDPSARAHARREGTLVLGALSQLVREPEVSVAPVEQAAPANVAPDAPLALVSAQPSSVNVEWWAATAVSAPAKTVTAARAAMPARPPQPPVRVAPPPRPASPPAAPAPKKEAPRAHAADDGEAVQAAQEARQQLANTF